MYIDNTLYTARNNSDRKAREDNSSQMNNNRFSAPHPRRYGIIFFFYSFL